MYSKISKKEVLYILLVILILLFIVGLYFANNYLKNNNYLFYATGTNDKAFMNSTWEMSVKEIERANHTKLSEARSLFCDALNYKARTQRISCYGDNIYLFGIETEVTYYFFDNKLYKYDLYIPVYGYPEVARILENLESRCGEAYSENITASDTPDSTRVQILGRRLSLDDLLMLTDGGFQSYTREWNNKKEGVIFQFYFPKNKLKEGHYNFKTKVKGEDEEISLSSTVFISFGYGPMINTMHEEIQAEESSYF